MTIYRNVPLSDLPQGHYQTGYIDPPWKYLTYSAKGLGKSPDRHYDTMTVDELKALPVRSLFAKKAILHVWVIDSHLEIALDVIRAWGFRYKTVSFYWAKTTKDGSGFPMGTGKWTRANPEHTLECVDEQEAERCLLASAKAGGPPRQSGGVPRLCVSPRREHSRKPDEIYERIEALTEGPYLELFSRSDRPGWDSWGDEAGMFAQQTAKRAVRPLEAEYAALI